MTKGPTKAAVKDGIRDVRRALRAAEKALDAGDWDGVIECMGYWAAPSSIGVADDVATALNINW